MTTTLAEQLPIEQARVREVLTIYRSIGAPGMFGAAMIEQSLRAADKAIANGDVVAMMHALKDLRDIEA